MASKQRRRLYEGFGVLDGKVAESKEEPSNSVESSSKHHSNSVELESFQDTNSVETLTKEPLKQSSNGVEQLDFNTIVGKEREFLFYIAYQCQKNGSLITEPLTGEVFKKDLDYSSDGLKTVIYRLTKKGFLIRSSTKIGRSGWVCFSLDRKIYDLIIKHKDYLNTIQTRFKHHSKQSRNGGYSSIELNNLNTIIQETVQFSIAENLSKVGIGQKQLLSILNLGTLSFDDIQSSLDQYSYDLSKGKKANLALFFGVLRKGSSYVSQEFTQILEAQISKELDRINRHQEFEKEKIKSEMYQKFQAFKNNRPEFLEEVRKAQTFNVSEQVLENLAFARFCEIET